jgi:hypothetical protein
MVIMHRTLGLNCRWLPITMIGLALGGAVGCGGPELYLVRGKVAFKNGAPVTPLVGGYVVFEPLDKENKHSARGDIQSDGTFRLGTHKEDDGVRPGEYKVLVVPPAPPPREEKRRKPVIQPRYHNLSETPLTFTVKRQDNECPLTVEPP